MESNRQKKIAKLIQQDLADILQKKIKDSGVKGLIVSVTKVWVTPDLSFAKNYLSIFPFEKSESLLNEITAFTPSIKRELAKRTKNQLRKLPDLLFFVDDSLEYIGKIEKSLKGDANPIENPDLLIKRKKS